MIAVCIAVLLAAGFLIMQTARRHTDAMRQLDAPRSLHDIYAGEE